MIKGIRTPVRRDDAATFIFLMLSVFAISVVGTRIYLEAAGYPQIGGGELHIAHVLWGGLALFIGGLVPLIYANRWAFRLGAVLSGLGVGFFIDEVGKFITANNNYFYPLAAPIIYVVFLITVLIFVRVRQPIRENPRVELYHALDGLREILDRDLNEREKTMLETRLTYVQDQAADADLKDLAAALLTFLHSQDVKILPDRQGVWARLWRAWLAFEQRSLGHETFRALVLILMGIAGVGAFAAAIAILRAVNAPTLDDFARAIVSNLNHIAGAASLSWAVTWIMLNLVCGLLLLIGTALTLFKHEGIGTRLGFYGLLISVTIIDLITFYFSQFTAVGIAALHFAALLLVLRYRARYLRGQAGAHGVL